MTPGKEKIRETLFSQTWYPTLEPGGLVPYADRLECEGAQEPSRFDEAELSVFGHVVEHEAKCYEQRGLVFGPLSLKVCYEEPFAARGCITADAIRLPTISDPEFVQIEACTATDLLVVEHAPVFHMLAASQSVRDCGLLVMTGSGIPRETTRQFIRRLNVEAGLRVHLLTDNDTWGYFIYSLLLRGAMGPHAHFPWAAIKEVNYIGIRSGDCELLNSPQDCFRPWDQRWSSRLRALRTYECFQSAEWQDELHRFEAQSYAVHSETFLLAFGGAEVFFRDYLSPRLQISVR